MGGDGTAGGRTKTVARQGCATASQGHGGAGCASSRDGGTCADRARSGESVALMRSLEKASCGECHLGLGRGAPMAKKGRAPATCAALGAGEFTEPGREQRARTFPADGFKVFSGCPRRLICHKGQMLYFSRRSLSSETLLLARQPQADSASPIHS